MSTLGPKCRKCGKDFPSDYELPEQGESGEAFLVEITGLCFDCLDEVEFFSETCERKISFNDPDPGCRGVGCYDSPDLDDPPPWCYEG
ncbi:hypothetical protein AKJ62_01285 [candidate division MSBL1 archaeon SCGC-AAA259D14]|uniref:Uncharacterized protein n=1 Tax=candidate division MSBL1 archaeon SCGC-AAA259D14 TaxID=1698261 RepID=A0A133U7T1_9EURY|nr:hypothetical protein AKJ62_01285 [candidate division MSBL1 archaeon SCGC-AAA259D14]